MVFKIQQFHCFSFILIRSHLQMFIEYHQTEWLSSKLNHFDPEQSVFVGNECFFQAKEILTTKLEFVAPLLPVVTGLVLFQFHGPCILRAVSRLNSFSLVIPLVLLLESRFSFLFTLCQFNMFFLSSKIQQPDFNQRKMFYASLISLEDL